MSEQLVKFNPSNPQHVEAYLCIRLHGKQHPTLRFELDEDFQSVPGMMEVMLADAYAASFKNSAENARAVLYGNAISEV